MSTDKKSALEKAAESLEFEKLGETESGKLTGGFSAPIADIAQEQAGDINISKCHCTTSPTKPAQP